METATKPVASRDPLRLARYVPAGAMRVLDCAAGDGALAAALKASVPARHIAGLGRESNPAAAAAIDELIVGDPYSVVLPWSNAFDCVLADGLLPCLRDPGPMLGRVFHALAPGGLVAMTAPNIQFYEHFLMLARGRWQLGGEGALNPRHIRFFTAYSLSALFQEAGFSSVRCGVLDSAPPEAFPLDATGHVALADLRVGPMSPDQHRAFLAREYLVLATKP